MIKLIYCSHSRIGRNAHAYAGIRDILAAARPVNTRLEITGTLLFSAASFAQILEGPPDAVDEVLGKIQADPRHDCVRLLARHDSASRRFTRWSMAFEHRNALDHAAPCVFRHALTAHDTNAATQIENLVSQSLLGTKTA